MIDMQQVAALLGQGAGQGGMPNGPASGNPTMQPAQPPQPQQPTYDPAKVIGEVGQKYSNWRSLKRPHEVQWFVNNAMLRGLQNVRWNDTLGQMESLKIPTHKMRPAINKILPKFRQRKAKFLKNRYTPIVIPASSDKEDKLNATASQLALEYCSRKTHLEEIYRQCLDWTMSCGKGFIGLYWDDNAMGLIKDPQSGQGVPDTIGDICFEAISPFEILVPDLGVQHIGDQHEYMRVRAVPLEELKRRYKDTPGIDNLKGDTNSEDLFQYQKQIASLSAKTNAGLMGGGITDRADRDLNFVVRKELFSRPCGQYPNGRYVVIAADMVLKYQEQLPYGLQGQKNPFPMVEFSDIELAGQFWPTCLVEQLIGPQREYNDLRAKLVNHMNKQVHPKVIVSAYSKWPTNAWTDEAGEVIRILTPPGIMEPRIVAPPPISQDLWNNLNVIRGEIDEISSLPPVAVGEAGSTTSGFQVNLLQEATDSVHSPDIRAHEMAYEELYRKARKIMAQGYTIPRLINIAGRAHIPDVVEFSTDNIDENAEIIVYTGSALSSSPAMRTQQVIELWNAGILQDPSNPAEAQRRVLGMLDANGIGEFQEEKKRDEEKARLENLTIGKGGNAKPPIPFDDHQIHYQQHTDQMKSPDFDSWPDPTQQELFAHTIMHVKFINPQQAVVLAQEMGLQQLIPMLMPPPQPPMGPPDPMQHTGGGNGGNSGNQQPPPPPQQPPPPPPPPTQQQG